MQKLSLENILSGMESVPYLEQYNYIMKLIEAICIKPIKASPKNGKKPALFSQYWSLESTNEYAEIEQELLYKLNAEIKIDYYQKHLNIYAKERLGVLLLSEFLSKHSELLKVKVSYNERCMQIWGYEKYLAKEAGKTLLKHCGLDLSFLNCYSTAEPFSYFSLHRDTPQKLLIIENKDTFFSMRKALLAGKQTLFGENISTLIYGAGKRILSSFQEFAISAEPYMLAEGNEFLYFGDLDYEGIGIYEKLAQLFTEQGKIVPYVAAYKLMLAKSTQVPRLPVTKEQQNKQLEGIFWHFFDQKTIDNMQSLLQKERYIPQEILNIKDF